MFGAWEAIPWHGIPLEKLNKKFKNHKCKNWLQLVEGFLIS